ncbi:hypothetical protein quinque_001377 [Culex quinquefasciatus]
MSTISLGSYELSDGHQVQQKATVKMLPDGTKLLVVDGFYSYVGPDGVKYSVHYTADENGYHPKLMKLSDGREVRQNAYWNELPDCTRFLQVNGFYSYRGPDGVNAPTERSVKVKNAELKVVDQSNNHDPEEFNWSYELSDGREVRQNAFWNTKPDGTRYLQVNGLYSYVGPDGVKYTVSYFADETGYHPTVIVGDQPLYPEGPQDIDPKVLASLLG